MILAKTDLKNWSGKTVFLLVNYDLQGEWIVLCDRTKDIVTSGKGDSIAFRSMMQHGVNACQCIALGMSKDYDTFIGKALYSSYLTCQPVYDAYSMLYALGIDIAGTALLRDNGSSMTWYEGTLQELLKLLLPVVVKDEKP